MYILENVRHKIYRCDPSFAYQKIPENIKTVLKFFLKTFKIKLKYIRIFQVKSDGYITLSLFRS